MRSSADVIVVSLGSRVLIRSSLLACSVHAPHTASRPISASVHQSPQLAPCPAGRIARTPSATAASRLASRRRRRSSAPSIGVVADLAGSSAHSPTTSTTPARRTTKVARTPSTPRLRRCRRRVRPLAISIELTAAVQELAPESLERALPEKIHPTGDGKVRPLAAPIRVDVRRSEPAAARSMYRFGSLQ